MVLTAFTLTLNNPSTAALTSRLVAVSGTRKVTWLCSEAAVDFSVITGERTSAYMASRESVVATAGMTRNLLISAEPPGVAPHRASAPACRGAECRRHWHPAAAARRPWAGCGRRGR